MEGVMPLLIEKVTNEFYQSSGSEDMHEPSETEVSSITETVGYSEEVTIETKTSLQPSKGKLAPDSGTGEEARNPVVEGQTANSQAAEVKAEGKKAEQVQLNKESGASTSLKVISTETSGQLAPGSDLWGEKGKKGETTSINRHGSLRDSVSVKPSMNIVHAPSIARLPVVKETAKVPAAVEDKQGSKTAAAKLTATEPLVLYARPSQQAYGDEKVKNTHSTPAVVDLTESPEKQKEGEKVNAFGQPANVAFINLVEGSGKTQG